MKPRLLVEETCHCTKSRTLNVCGNSGHDFQTKGKFPNFNGKLNNKEMGDLSLRGKTHNSLSISNSDALIVLLSATDVKWTRAYFTFKKKFVPTYYLSLFTVLNPSLIDERIQRIFFFLGEGGGVVGGRWRNSSSAH